ncbi:MAG: hypothetical protein WCJ61_07570 [Paludibacter sp.]
MNLFKRKKKDQSIESIDSESVSRTKNEFLIFKNAIENNIDNFEDAFNPLVWEEYDEFKEETITEIHYPSHKYSHYINVYNDKKNFTIELSIRAINSSKKTQIYIEFSCETYKYKSSSYSQFHNYEDYISLDKGKMIIRINDKMNFSVKPNKTKLSFGDYINTEKGNYLISEDQLKQICEAKTVELKIYGESLEHYIGYNLENYTPSSSSYMNNILPSERFLFMCRAFYTSLYKDKTYLEWIYNNFK